MQPFVSEEQTEFRSNRSTVHQMFILTLIEKSLTSKHKNKTKKRVQLLHRLQKSIP